MHFLRGLADFVIPAAQAHEKWYVPLSPVRYAVPDFYRTLNPLTVGALVFLVAACIGGYFLNRWYERSPRFTPFETKLRTLRDFGAPTLAVTTGLALIIMAYNWQFLAANYPLLHDVPGTVLRAAEALVGGLFLIGLFTPAAAIGLLALYLSLFLVQPLIEPIDYVNFAGIGLFLLFFARGRYSLDWFLGKPILTTASQRKWAYVALRFLTGFTILWLAIWKWWRPDLHLSLMDLYPHSNPYVLLTSLGMHMTREVYVFLLAVAEAALGIFVMFGFLTRPVAVVLVPVFIVSMLFLGPSELVGHLPILGTLFVLIVYGGTYAKHREPGRYEKKIGVPVENEKAAV